MSNLDDQKCDYAELKQTIIALQNSAVYNLKNEVDDNYDEYEIYELYRMHERNILRTCLDKKIQKNRFRSNYYILFYPYVRYWDYLLPDKKRVTKNTQKPPLLKPATTH